MTHEKRQQIRRWKQLVLRRLFCEKDLKLRLELIETLRTLELWDQGNLNVIEAAEQIADKRAFQQILAEWLRLQRKGTGRQAGGRRRRPNFT